MLKILQRIGAFFLDLIETIVIALSIFVIIYLFLFQPHQVRGSSMYPTFNDGEYLLTNKISYRFEEPQRGDVVIFRAPRNEEYDYIKRIIGLPGESIKVERGKIFINNNLLPESYLPESYVTSGGGFLREGQSITIPLGTYFVCGDNRSHSSDSREWGFVPRENIVGKSWFRYWPPQRFGAIPKANYTTTSTSL